jgi:hypothetical protein
MIEFKSGIDARARAPKQPTVAKFWVTNDKLAYCVIGTDYGYIHTSAGDVRVWNSRSGAYKAAKDYCGF